MLGNRLIKSNDAAAGGCTDIVDNYDPFEGGGLALYQLNGNANDVSGNYNGIDVRGLSYVDGVFGQAASFASNGNFNTGYSLSGSYTISLWCKNTATGYNIFSTGNSQNDVGIIFRGLRSGAVTFIDGWGGLGIGQYVVHSYTYPQDTNWHHFALSFTNNNNCKIYFDGALILDFNSAQATFSQSSPLTFGESLYASNDPTGINLDQVRIFNTALTPLEVEALYTEELCICDGTVDTLDILGDGSCIATYPLDGNANDLSGNYSGTPTDVSYGVGEFDLAGVFNGNSSVINVDSFVSTSVFAISFWLKAPAPVNWNSLIQSPNTDINSNQINTLFGHIGYFPDGGYNAGYIYVDSSIINVQDNNWHHIVLTCGGTYATTQIYIDGISRTLTGNGTLMQLRGTLNIGQRINGTDTLNGQLDQVRIFNKALNSTEVTTLYNETACTNTTRTAGATQILGDSSCIAYYKLDGTSADETGNYNGTFTNPNYGNGEFDFAGLFTGSNGIATPVYNRPGNTAWSFSAWTYIYESNMSGVLGAFFDGSVSYDQHLFFNTYQGRIQFGQYGSVGYGENLLPTNQWLHLVYTRNTNNSVAVFVNGSQITLKSGSDGSGTVVTSFATLNLKNEPFNIGKHGTGGNYKGLIDQIRIFNKAVSQSEVTTLYNEGI